MTALLSAPTPSAHADVPPAILAGWLYVPHEVVGGPQARGQMKADLTHVPPPRRGDRGDPKHVYLFDDESVPGYLGVPRAWGLRRFPGLAVADHTTLGAPMLGVQRLPDPHHPSVQDPAAQSAFMAALLAAIQRQNTLCAMAATGSGKTAVTLWVAGQLKRKLLVLLHLDRLALQWCDEAHNLLGIPRHRIGMVAGDVCDWQDKDVVVGLMHSVANRQYAPEFYTSFGMVAVDEVHKAGCGFFAPAIPLFPARYKLGLSATPTRKDKGERVFFSHLGDIAVVSEAAAMDCRVHVMPYDGSPVTARGEDHGVMVRNMVRDPRRNAFLGRLIKRLWERGRQALVVSESVGHLQTLMRITQEAGIPASAMGLFTGSREEVRPGADGRPRLVKVKQRKEDLDRMQAEAQLLFATYAMFTEGMNVPRLDAGLDATPRPDATQLIGRIRRPLPGKRLPLWVTPLDIRSERAVAYYRKRCKDYRATGAEIMENGTQASGADAGTAGRAQEAVLGRGAQRAPAAAVRREPRGPADHGAAGATGTPAAPRGGWGGGSPRGLPHQPAAGGQAGAGAAGGAAGWHRTVGRNAADR